MASFVSGSTKVVSLFKAESVNVDGKELRLDNKNEAAGEAAVTKATSAIEESLILDASKSTLLGYREALAL